jgi:hypothetical protein
MQHQETNAFTLEKLRDLSQRIRNVPVVDYDPWKSERPLTRLEMVALIKDEIAGMRDKGYRVVEIAEFLNANGFTISAAWLYEAMRELGCSLRRAPVPVAMRLRKHLAHQEFDTACVTTASRESAANGHLDGTSRPSQVMRLTMLPKAQRRLDKLHASVATVFKQGILQLQYGVQRVHLAPETGDAVQILMQAGLLNPILGHGDGVFEVPYEMAHVQTSRPRTCAGRHVGAAAE